MSFFKNHLVSIQQIYFCYSNLVNGKWFCELILKKGPFYSLQLSDSVARKTDQISLWLSLQLRPSPALLSLSLALFPRPSSPSLALFRHSLWPLSLFIHPSLSLSLLLGPRNHPARSSLGFGPHCRKGSHQVPSALDCGTIVHFKKTETYTTNPPENGNGVAFRTSLTLADLKWKKAQKCWQPTQRRQR